MIEQKNLFGETEFIINDEYVIISLMEEYFLSILSGEKKYEYRRKFIDRPCKAFIYVNYPVMSIKGLVDFDKPIIDRVDRICQIAEKQRAGSTPGMLTYLEGLDRAFAIPIRSLTTFAPLKLSTLRQIFPEFSPPQFFISVNKRPKLLKFLLEYVEKNKYESRNL